MRTRTPLQLLIDKYKKDYFVEFRGLRLTDLNEKGISGDTLLHLVASVGTVEETDLLVAAGADVNSVGDMGYTPLHYAAGRGRPEMVTRLLELGADPTLRNAFGTTPPESSDLNEHLEIAALIRGFNK